MKRASAISRLLFPCAIRRTTSRSRRVSGSRVSEGQRVRRAPLALLASASSFRAGVRPGSSTAAIPTPRGREPVPSSPVGRAAGPAMRARRRHAMRRRAARVSARLRAPLRALHGHHWCDGARRAHPHGRGGRRASNAPPHRRAAVAPADACNRAPSPDGRATALSSASARRRAAFGDRARPFPRGEERGKQCLCLRLLAASNGAQGQAPLCLPDELHRAHRPRAVARARVKISDASFKAPRCVSMIPCASRAMTSHCW